MKPARFLTPLLAAALLLPAAGTPWAAPVQVSDDRGSSQRWEAPPERIVSLLPSLTESLCALGQCDRLVGVDRYSNWPSSVRTLPQLGGGIDPDVERVLSLRPDAVLIAPSSQALQRLQALGLKVLALEPHTLADLRRVLGVLATLTGAGPERAQQVWRGIEEAVQAEAKTLPPAARHARVYIEVDPGPHGAGPASFVGELLARLGPRNILPASLGPFPKINPEFVVRADPDLIMVGEQTAPELARRPGWADMRAVREGRVCVFPQTQSDVLVRPGPRMAEAAGLMARCLREKLAPGSGRTPGGSR